MTSAFSVVVPVHDKRDHLERAVDSILGQSHERFELLLVDDASTDGSGDLLRSFDDPRITLLERSVPGPGGYAARNLAIRAARHDWICFLDADDSWHPDFLATIAALRHDHPDADLLATGWRFRSDAEPDDWQPLDHSAAARARPLALVDYARDQSLLCVINTTVRTSVVRGVGGFPEHPDRRRGADIDTIVRCLAASGGSWRVDDELATYYQGTANQVTDSSVAPPPSVPAATSLARLRADADDPEVRAALRAFQDRLVYTRLANRVRAGRPVTWPLLRSLSWTPYGASRSAKVLALRLRALANASMVASEATPTDSTNARPADVTSVDRVELDVHDGSATRDRRIRAATTSWVLVARRPLPDDAADRAADVLDTIGPRTALLLSPDAAPGAGPWLVRRDAFLQLGGLPATLDDPAADQELILRFIDAGYEVERRLDPSWSADRPPASPADADARVRRDVAAAVVLAVRCLPVRDVLPWTTRAVRRARSIATPRPAWPTIAAELSRGGRVAVGERRRRRAVRAETVRAARSARLLG